jgi:hypothetical protein
MLRDTEAVTLGQAFTHPKLILDAVSRLTFGAVTGVKCGFHALIPSLGLCSSRPSAILAAASHSIYCSRRMRHFRVFRLAIQPLWTASCRLLRKKEAAATFKAALAQVASVGAICVEQQQQHVRLDSAVLLPNPAVKVLDYQPAIPKVKTRRKGHPRRLPAP